MIPLPFHSYRLRSRKGAQTRLLNCFASASPPEGRSPTRVEGIPGITSFSTIEKSPQRAGIEYQGSLYCVAGNGFYRVSVDGTETLLGTVSGASPVDIDKNTSQIAVLIEPNLWVYESGTLTLVSDTDFTSRGAKRMSVMDNYGAFIEPSSGRWFICDLSDFTVYDALDFATAEGNPDNLLSIESNNRQFILFGEKSIELWDNIGGAGFPFERVPNGYVENGCGAPYSTCAADNTVFWIDQDRLARRLEGNVPRRISNEGVEQAWQDYSTISDAIGFSYVHDGHTFVVFQFPTAGATWVYDINTGEWHERRSYGSDQWRAAWVAKAYGKTLVGDTESGNVGEISSTVYQEWGGELLREATTGVVYDQGRDLFHDHIALDMEVGRNGGYIQLDISDNGGMNFVNVSNRELGAVGNYKTTVDWYRLGRTDERVYRFRVTDNVPFNLYAARQEVR